MKKGFLLGLICLLLLSGCSKAPGTVSSTVGDAGDVQAGGLLDEVLLTNATLPPDGAGQNALSAVIPVPTGDMVEIKEKLFIAQTNDIYLNPQDYLGKIIKYEGIFQIYEDAEPKYNYYSVIRYGPGCCGYDANAGFEVKWDQPYPQPNDWVEVVGVLEEYEQDGFPYLRLAIQSLTVMETRGQETVTQ